MTDGRILIADDEDSLRWVLEKGFRGAGYQVTAVKDGTAALAEVAGQPFDLILLDVRMPGIDGLSLLKQIRERRADAQVVIMTAHGTMETAIQAMQHGAYDYLAKPFDLDEALLLAERALTARRLSQEVSALRTGLREVWEFGALVGRHPTMQEVYKAIGARGGQRRQRAAARRVGHRQGGGGARAPPLQPPRGPAVRRSSPRPPFPSPCSSPSCSATRRAPSPTPRSGASASSSWPTAAPSSSTRSATCRAELQVKLLRVLQERAFERVGGHELIRMDVRVLAATHRDLEALMKAGRFREDLFYRLNVVTLPLPALRERRGDIPLLVEHFLAKYAESLGERVVAADALDRLVGYDWPGNVRELENVIQRAMVMASSGVILPEHLPIGPVSAAAAVARGRLARGHHRAEDARVRARPARPCLRQPARSDGRARGEAPAPRGDARDQGQPGARRPAPRHQPQYPAQEAQGARHRPRRGH